MNTEYMANTYERTSFPNKQQNALIYYVKHQKQQ